jgi:hypothetical protein
MIEGIGRERDEEGGRGRRRERGSDCGREVGWREERERERVLDGKGSVRWFLRPPIYQAVFEFLLRYPSGYLSP